MDRLPDLSSLSHDEKDALIHALWAQVQSLTGSLLSAGASGLAVAQGTHTGVVTGEFGRAEAKIGISPDGSLDCLAVGWSDGLVLGIAGPGRYHGAGRD